jgi:hypothetical protein
MAAEITIIQKSGLNRYIDPPPTWEDRKRMFKPLLVFSGSIYILLFEQLITRVWLNGHVTGRIILQTLGSLLPILAVLLLGPEFQMRVRYWTKRRFELREKKIMAIPGGTRFIKWENVKKFQFVPVEEAPELRMLILWHDRKRFPQNPGRWRMILEGPKQVEELSRCLAAKKLKAPLNFEIEMLAEPEKREPPKAVSLLPLVLSMVGMVCFLNGFPLLMIWFMVKFSFKPVPSHGTGTNSDAVQFIANHFSSRTELLNFLLFLGLELTVMGILLSVATRKLKDKSRSEVPG